MGWSMWSTEELEEGESRCPGAWDKPWAVAPRVGRFEGYVAASHVWGLSMLGAFVCHRRAFYDRRISQEVEGEHLGDEFAGYVFRISGGNDKQGFPMKQGVLTNNRVRLLLKKGLSCYRPRRKVRKQPRRR